MFCVKAFLILLICFYLDDLVERDKNNDEGDFSYFFASINCFYLMICVVKFVNAVFCFLFIYSYGTNFLYHSSVFPSD